MFDDLGVVDVDSDKDCSDVDVVQGDRYLRLERQQITRAKVLIGRIISVF